jgi:uncharacterized protein (TIGR02594 family)
MSSLRRGDKGPAVAKLQRLLNASLIPSPRLKEDGDFGNKTHEAVVRFQGQKSLKPDGIVGPQTWTALGQKIATPPSPPPSPGTSAVPWMKIAVDEVGIHEDALPGAHTPRILEYHTATSLHASTDETPWCSSFINWVMMKAGYEGTNNALAKSWLEWGVSLASPREGAITVIKKKDAGSDAATGSSTGFHVALYVGSTPSHIRLLGGNQGDQVKYSNFSLSSYEVKGYRWPS